MLHAPDVYMDKIAIGGGLGEVVDLDETPATNLKNLAKAKKREVADMMVCILDRPRHAELIAKVREAGARIMLISDGDVAGVIATTRPDTGIDLYVGSGGAPEGVLAAAALRCIGGHMQGRLLFRNDDERSSREARRHQGLEPQIRSDRPRQGRCPVCRYRRDRRQHVARREAAFRRRHDAIAGDAIEDGHGADHRGDPRFFPQPRHGGVLAMIAPVSI